MLKVQIHSSNRTVAPDKHTLSVDILKPLNRGQISGLTSTQYQTLKQDPAIKAPPSKHVRFPA